MRILVRPPLIIYILATFGIITFEPANVWRAWCPDIGANPSAEEAEEGVEDNATLVIDVAHSFRLNETSFDKKSYLSHLKSELRAMLLKILAQVDIIFSIYEGG